MARPTHPLALARKKFSRHRAQARFRNIEFDFDFPAWYDWWLAHGVDKNINTKWQGDYRPCMCRKGDTGGYTATNVYFANHVDNVLDAHKNNRGNARGSRTQKNYRWGDQILTLYELLAQYPSVTDGTRHLFRVDTYDQKNQHETLRLINRYNNLPNRTRKLWITPAGTFTDVTLAAKSVGLKKDTFRYWCQRGKYQAVVELLVPTLREYIIQNSRYPDPYLPDDLESL